MKRKFLIILIVFIFFIISCISIGYSAFNTSLSISGDAMVRPDSEIRITDLVLLSKNNGGSETYNSSYSKSLTSMSVSLSNTNSSVVYRVTVNNKNNSYYSIKSISLISSSNSNISYSISGVNIGDIFHDNILTFDVTFTTSLLNQSGNITLKYNFEVVKKTEWIFDYTGGDQSFSVPYNSTYKLEVWGAQGGSKINVSAGGAGSIFGGYGGYSYGSILLNSNDKLHVFVGGEGVSTDEGLNPTVIKGAYPNGGAIDIGLNPQHKFNFNGGGGSTYIAKSSKSITELGIGSNDLIIVAGGGGGVCNWWGVIASGGHGGGYLGGDTTANYMSVNATGGTQSEGGYGGGNNDGHNRANEWLAGKIGLGGGYNTYANPINVSGGGGGGYFGGGASWGGPGAGGSGYIGNSRLTNKAMYCFNCSESTTANTYTVSTTGSSSNTDKAKCSAGYSSSPIGKCAKAGNGYAKISLILN